MAHNSCEMHNIMIYYGYTLCTAYDLQYKLSRPRRLSLEPGRASDSGYWYIRGTVAANTGYVGVSFYLNLCKKMTESYTESSFSD